MIKHNSQACTYVLITLPTNFIQADELLSCRETETASNIWKIASEEVMKRWPGRYLAQVVNKPATGAIGIASQEVA